MQHFTCSRFYKILALAYGFSSKVELAVFILQHFTPVRPINGLRPTVRPSDSYLNGLGPSVRPHYCPSVRFIPHWIRADRPSVRYKPTWGCSIVRPPVRVIPQWFRADRPSVRFIPQWFRADRPSQPGGGEQLRWGSNSLGETGIPTP